MAMLQALSNDRIRAVAPSVFAEQPHESRSERYVYIPTVQIVDAMRAEGFYPVAVAQSRSRIEGKSEFTKHMIRFRRENVPATARAVGDVLTETVLVNSHDGTSSYHLMSGLFRLACLNGMIAKLTDLGDIKVPHSGKIIDRVIEGSYRVIDHSAKALERAAEWTGVTLALPEIRAYAQAAAALRFDPEQQPVNAERMIEPRRYADRSNDLFTVMNRAQEALIRGGSRYRSPEGRRQSARAVGSIDKNVSLNQALWTLTEEMAKLKAA